ncbi:hypothetical protein FHT86_007009 [Rhizobium sp. BK313]|uniref:hypothetical protein n=1 Tax=Rhizobium sp. BK313 TaxID=2587081 RepID=UPI00179B3176|nr:hypothetical protein [Rhizobium sp. BK313]MBB3458683.1 hypothetical protein [Rhizobium sp. BK313]
MTANCGDGKQDHYSKMISKYLGKLGVILDSTDLAICQRAFDAILQKWKIARDTEDAEQTAATIITLYKQGIHDENKLVTLASPHPQRK